jgi:hypothetical protein
METSGTGVVRVHHAVQNGAELKTHELFISGIFHLILLDLSCLGVIETMASETRAERGRRGRTAQGSK